MKLVKMSLAAAVMLGTSAYAIDNVKVSGDAKLFYGTNNMDYTKDGVTQNGLFEQGVAGEGGSYADTALRLGVTADLLKNVSMGATVYAVSTLGLENNLVSNTWTGAHGATNGVDDNWWFGEIWLAGTVGKTTAKVGRMELDTPLAFSEKWSIVPNTFDATVLINQDIPDTTVIGAWVGKGNGYNVGQGVDLGHGVVGYVNAPAVGIDGILGAKAKFETFGDQGAYAVALVNNSFKPLTAQAWYYNVTDIADAFWLQADVACQLVKGLSIGAQYAEISPKGTLEAAASNNSSAYAFKIGYAGIENLKLSAAYSKADDEGVVKIANVATNNLGGAQSKLYTEAWWNYGYVGAPDARTYNITAEYDVKNIAKFGVYYTDVSIDTTNAVNALINGKENVDMKEVAITASKSFGALDATLAYISTDADDQNLDASLNGQRYDSIQAYLTLNF